MTTHGDPRAVVQSVQRAIASSPAFRNLDDRTKAELGEAFQRIGAYLGTKPVDLRAAALAEPDEAEPAPSNGTGGTTGRVGEVARATLDAIDFPSFVSGLVTGVFQAIVDATIQQLEAYATLLQEVTKTVDEYMQDNVSDAAAKDYLADRYPSVMTRNTSSGTPVLEVNRTDPAATLPSFFTDLGFDSAAQIDPVSVDEVLVPAARKTIAEQRHQTLATMVLMGLNRIVIDDGEINAKLVFHVDASETMEITFDSTQTNIGTLAGVSGTSQFSGTGIMVNTTNVNAQSDINVRADLTGEVRVHFKSDYLTLNKFADSNAIQLINQHATVPSTNTTPAVSPAADGAAAGDDTTASQAVQQQALSPPVPARAARLDSDDPWSPRR